MSRIPIVDTIIEKDGKILVLQRAFEPKGRLDLPGGFVNKGESIEAAAIRETKEESGFDVRLVKKLGAFDCFERGEKTYHVFIGEIIGGELKASVEGTPLWMGIEKISAGDLAFPQVHVLVLNEYFKWRNLPFRL